VKKILLSALMSTILGSAAVISSDISSSDEAISRSAQSIDEQLSALKTRIDAVQLISEPVVNLPIPQSLPYDEVRAFFASNDSTYEKDGIVFTATKSEIPFYKATSFSLIARAARLAANVSDLTLKGFDTDNGKAEYEFTTVVATRKVVFNIQNLSAVKESPIAIEKFTKSMLDMTDIAKNFIFIKYLMNLDTTNVNMYKNISCTIDNRLGDLFDAIGKNGGISQEVIDDVSSAKKSISDAISEFITSRAMIASDSESEDETSSSSSVEVKAEQPIVETTVFAKPVGSQSAGRDALLASIRKGKELNKTNAVVSKQEGGFLSVLKGALYGKFASVAGSEQGSEQGDDSDSSWDD
jgi:hypothetical protein